ncbi:ferrochelatase [Entomobacter blattae]|uniref:Ferrochelatase n=1 Tax=Entomobacter blattae TaxID=2762277 RepID=A0A7H1NNZ6_9PROT|nr:ferrochelatase [Entomobacter blattae]QNT77506.1 Ferrochelatase [Entomobacter blattae]
MVKFIGVAQSQEKQSVRQSKIGVLLINLGTPEAPTYWSVRQYLSEFLSDPRVIESSPLIWQPLLQGVILSLRSQKTAKAYKRIWNTPTNESPLRLYSRLQAESLSELFEQDDIEIEWAMRYGMPTVKNAIQALLEKRVERLLLFPLYPQYSATTTATALDQCFRALMQFRRQPAIRSVPSFSKEELYIQALAALIRRHYENLPHRPEKLIISFHGLPKSYIDAGDYYDAECQATGEALRSELGMDDTEAPLTYQSRFGPAQWLEPSTQAVVKEFAQQGVKRIAIMAPGFVADCIETLDELGTELRESFYAHGGEQFSLIPCLNDSYEGIELFASLIRKELKGWLNS